MSAQVRWRSAFAWLVAATVCVPGWALAQRQYPSFQLPRVSDRDYNFLGSDGGNSTALVFQWRESAGANSQLSLDVGVRDRSGVGPATSVLLGGQFAHQLRRATADMPLDLLFTTGIYTDLASGNSSFGIPVGVVVGHRFDLQGGMSVTPFAQPRLSLNRDVRRVDRTNIDPTLELGGSFQFNPNLALRGSVLLGDLDVAGISITWTPTAVKRLVH